MLFWGDKEARDDFNARNFFHRFLVNGIFCDGSKCGKLVQKSGGNMNKFSQAHFSVVFEYSGHHHSMYRMEHEGSGDYAQFI